MQQTKIVEESWVVDKELEKLGVESAELVQIVDKVVMARNGSVAIDPACASGMFAYIYGTRAIREAFLPKGWKLDRTDNIESVINPETKIKIIYQSVDSASDASRDPRAISGKGSAAERMVGSNQPYLSPEMETKTLLGQGNSTVWFFCVYVNGDDVRAELSCPHSIKCNQFKRFNSRLFILKSGEWNKVDLIDDDDGSKGQDLEITISRK